MSESIQPNKRSREQEEFEENKRHKSYNDILSILEEDEEYGLECDPISETGSYIFTTLQQELELLPSSGGDDILGSDLVENNFTGSTPGGTQQQEDDRSSVIRHLLEASDDELGIPSGDGINGSDFPLVEENENENENETNGGDFPFAISDGLWELEDEAANYYSLLQSELFM